MSKYMRIALAAICLGFVVLVLVAMKLDAAANIRAVQEKEAVK